MVAFLDDRCAHGQYASDDNGSATSDRHFIKRSRGVGWLAGPRSRFGSGGRLVDALRIVTPEHVKPSLELQQWPRLTDLEESGAVKLSPDHGIEHVRIAAITQAGRDQIAQAA